MSGLIAPWFLQQFRDTNGSPLAGGKLYFYVAGSTTVPKNVYVDYPLTTPYSQPVILDGSGFAPEYFMETGLYKIVVLAADGRLIATRDNVQGVGGTGTGGDAFSFYISASDSDGGYFADKVIDSPSVQWVRDDVGGYQRVKAVVNTAGILDYKVKADGADSTPSYLNAKLEAGNYIGVTLNNTTHKLKIDFNGPAYVPQAGGTFTGPVSFGSTVMATGGCFFGDTIFSEGITVAGSASVQSLVITDLIASGPGFLICDNTGAVSSVPGTPGKVQYSGADAIPGYLGTKIVAGTGITINTTVDGVNGTVMHINAATTAANKVKYDAADTLAGYLGTKLVAGNGINISTATGVNGTVMTLTKSSDYLETNISSTTPVAFGAATNVTLGSLVLPAGDWDVEAIMTAQVTFASGTARAEGYAVYWSTGDYGLKDYDTHGVLQSVAASAPYLATLSWTLSRRRWNLTSPTTVYVGATLAGTYTNGSAWGNITARRLG